MMALLIMALICSLIITIATLAAVFNSSETITTARLITFGITVTPTTYLLLDLFGVGR